MATEYKIIKIRGGLEADFYPAMLLPREMYISTDKGWMYYCYSAGNVKRFTTIEDIKNEITGATQEIIDEITEAVEQATIYAKAQGDYALEQGDYAKAQGDYANQKGQEAQAIIDSAAPIINTNLQATYADKGVLTGESLHTDVADDALVEITKIEGNTLVTPTNPLLDISPDNVATITSAKDFDIVACGKNLFPYPYQSQTCTLNGITYTVNNDRSITINGTATALSNFTIAGSYSSIIPLMVFKAGVTYTLKGTGNSNITILAGETGKTPFMSTSSNNLTYTMTADRVCTRYIINIAQGVTINNVTIHPQLELDSTSTPYEPYKSSKLTITKELNKLENGVADTRERIDDRYVKYTHRIGEIVFDGSADESWSLAQTLDNTLRFTSRLPGGADTNTIKTIASRFKCTLSGDMADYEHLRNGATGYGDTFALYINKSRLVTQDVAGLKAWLQSNPVTVLYELAELIETIVEEPSYLTSYKGVTNVFTTADVQPKLTGTFKSELWAREYGKLDKDGDSRDNVVTFTEATTEADIVSGEKHSVLFGKILKSIKTFRSAIGTLSSLTTTVKTSLVAAINELNTGLDYTNNEVDTINDNLANIIESGSNLNGDWIKFSSGIMICWCNIDTTITATSAYGSFYIGDTTWTYPQSFVEPPTANIGMARYSNGACLCSCAAASENSSVLRIFEVTQRTSHPYNIRASAIGRWK